MKALDRLSPVDRAKAMEMLARGLVGPERLERAIDRHLRALGAGQPSDLNVLLLQESAALAQSLDLSASQSARSQPRMGPYLLLGELGRGGMGRVYRARHVATGRDVALKVLNEGAGSEEWARFQREAVTLARLRHPGIVPIVDYGEAGGCPYLALELVEGQTLAERIKRGGPLPYDEAIDLTLQVARALGAAHAQGVLHRDLKPANVLLRGHQALLTDFGLSRSTVVDDARLTATGMVVGTPAYMAPEQVRGAELDERADVYSLGASLYEMLTGQPPFAGRSAIATMTAALEEEPQPPGKLRPDLPAELEQLCLRCLRKDPAQRYLDAATLVQELQRLTRGSSFVLRAPELVSTSLVALRQRARLLVSTLALVAVALCGASLGIVLERRKEGARRSGGGGGAAGADALAAQAELARLGGAPGQASRLCAQALALAPAHPLALTTRARLRAAGGLLAAALADSQRACAGAPQAAAFACQAELLAAWDPPAALLAAERAVELDPGSPPAQLLAARLRLRRGDRTGSRRALETALRLDPRSGPAWELASWLSEAEGDLPRAAAEQELAARWGPESASGWERLGRLRAAAGEQERAERACSRALAIDPGRRAARAERARARTALQRWSAAAEDLDALARDGRLSVEQLVLRSWVRFRRADIPGAREDARAAAAASPEDPRAWTALALSHLIPGDPLRMVGWSRSPREALDRARKLGADDARWWLAEGLLAFFENRLDEADQALGRAAQLEPGEGYHLLLRGSARSRAGQTAAAQADLTAGLERSPLDEGGWVNLANILNGAGDQAGSLALLERAWAAGVDTMQVHANRAVLLSGLGRTDEAQEAAMRAIHRDPMASDAWCALARAAYTARRYELAVQAATRAINLGDDLALPLALRGLALAGLGKAGEARGDLSRSLELAPQAGWAGQVRQALARLGD